MINNNINCIDRLSTEIVINYPAIISIICIIFRKSEL